MIIVWTTKNSGYTTYPTLNGLPVLDWVASESPPAVPLTGKLYLIPFQSATLMLLPENQGTLIIEE